MREYTVTWQLGKMRGTFQLEAADFQDAVRRLTSVDDLHDDAEVVGIKETVRRSKQGVLL